MIDRLFYFLYSFSRKHRDTKDHIGSNVVVISILCSLNIIIAISVGASALGFPFIIPKLMALVILLLIYASFSWYFYRGKRYLKIIRKYGKIDENKYINALLSFYIIISILSIFIVGGIRYVSIHGVNW